LLLLLLYLLVLLEPLLLGLLLLGLLLGLLVLPLELGELLLLLEEPMPLELGVLELELPLVDPPELEPLEELDLLKYASHSLRDTWPSLFVSTVEKLGAMLLEEAPPLAPPLDALPPLDMPDEPDEPLEPVALGEDDEPEPEAPVDDDPELCAIDTLAIAKSAAAVAVPTSFSIWRFLLRRIKG
jgi:hypothetical protein